MLGFVFIISVFVYGILKICKTVQRYFYNDVNVKGNDVRTVKSSCIGAPAIQLSSPKCLELHQTEFDEHVFVGQQIIENVYLLPVSYNIKANNPKNFIVKPRRGIIEPGQSVQVTFYLKTKKNGGCRYQPENIKVVLKVLEQCATPNDSLVKMFKPSLPYAEQSKIFTCKAIPPVEDSDESSEEEEDQVPNSSKWKILIKILIGVFVVFVVLPSLQWYVFEPLARWIAYERMPYRCKLLYQLSPTASRTAGFLGCPRWVFT